MGPMTGRTINAKLYYKKGTLCQSIYRTPVSIYVDSCNVETDIISFTTVGQINPEIIDNVNKEVYLVVSDTIDLATIVPVITVSYGATIIPASGVMQDFTNSPVTYTVTGMDGVTQTDWFVTIENAPNLLTFDNNPQITIFPNPAQEAVWIEAPMTGTISLTDITGKKIFQTTFSNHKEINLKGVSKGIYILSIKNGKYSIKQKLVVE